MCERELFLRFQAAINNAAALYAYVCYRKCVHMTHVSPMIN